MKHLFATSLFVMVLFCFSNLSYAQNTLGFSGTTACCAPAGSGITATDKTVEFRQGQAIAAPPGAVYTPTTTVTIGFQNQQFSSIEGNPGVPGIVFGGSVTSGAGASNTAPGFTYWNALSGFGGTYINNFTACNTCPNVSNTTTSNINELRYTTLGAMEFILYTDALIDAAGNAANSNVDGFPGHPNLSGRFYYGDITLTFNRPVSNPVIHFADIGGRVNYNTNVGGSIVNYVLGFTTDFKLITPGLTLTRLSGTTSLSVVNGDSIYNNATLFGAPSSGETYAGQARTAASGSVMVAGTNITTVTFRVTLRGDGGNIRNSTGVAGAAAAATGANVVRWALHGGFQPCINLGGSCTPAGGINLVSGDGILMAIGMQRPVNVSGNIFHDIDGGNVNSSSAVAIPAGIYANLVDANGKVVASQLVPNTGGTAGQFSFAGVGEGDYTVSISTTPGVQGLTKPAEGLPAGWMNTGEFNGTPNTGNDGTINGISAGFTVTTSDITNINFGVQRGPESAFNLQPSTGNPGGFNSTAVPAGAFQLNNVGVTPNTQDYDGGTVASIRITSFPVNANAITINGITYINGGACAPGNSCTVWPAAGIIVPYNNGIGVAQAISVDPIEGNVDVVIPFAAIDNAGTQDPTPGSVTIPFRTISLSGTVFNDLNANIPTVGAPEAGEAVINGTNTGGGVTTGAVLYANLVDAGGKIIASVPVQNDGTYNFPNVPQNSSGLAVQISTNQGTVGLNKPATAIPAGWVTTGENNNGQQTAIADGPNSEIPVITGTVNISQQNFGIQQLPESAVHSETIGVNPGNTVNTTVNPAWFQSSNVGLNPNTQDFNGGTVSNIRITAFPANATSITINGVTYTSASWPPAGVTIPYNNGVGPLQIITVDPIDGIVDVTIPFVSIDNAGAEDPTPGSVTLKYTSTLPIRLVYFTGRAVNDCGIQLTWQTATEDNLEKYLLEQSNNGIIFREIKTILPTGSGSTYSVVDDNAVRGGTTYYRLRSRDKDAREQLSNVVPVKSACREKLKVYPNPAGNQVTIEGVTASELTQVQLFNANGKLLFSNPYNGRNTIPVNVRSLPAGIYQLKVIGSAYVEIIKLVKQ